MKSFNVERSYMDKIEQYCGAVPQARSYKEQALRCLLALRLIQDSLDSGRDWMNSKHWETVKAHISPNVKRITADLLWPFDPEIKAIYRTL